MDTNRKAKVRIEEGWWRLYHRYSIYHQSMRPIWFPLRIAEKCANVPTLFETFKLAQYFAKQ